MAEGGRDGKDGNNRKSSDVFFNHRRGGGGPSGASVGSSNKPLNCRQINSTM